MIVQLLAATLLFFLPTPSDTANCRVASRAGHGNAKYDPTSGGIFWKIKKWKGHEEKSVVAIIDRIETGQRQYWDRPPMTVQFSVPFAASGFQVISVMIAEKSGYESSKWVKYQSEAGTFQQKLEMY